MRRRVSLAAAALAVGAGATLLVAPSAEASYCYITSQGKVCRNGFVSGDFGSRQFLGMRNSYNYSIYYTVQSRTGQRALECVPGRTTRWYDRDTASVTMGYWAHPGISQGPQACVR